MSNTIKYSESTEQRALNKGNWYIGTGDVNKGPSDVTGFYAGIETPISGYTIYVLRENGLPSIFAAQNDQELIFLTNQISENNYSTVYECYNYFNSQDDKLLLNKDYKQIPTEGMILNIDCTFLPSYPRSGNTWNDISISGNNYTITTTGNGTYIGKDLKIKTSGPNEYRLNYNDNGEVSGILIESGNTNYFSDNVNYSIGNSGFEKQVIVGDGPYGLNSVRFETKISVTQREYRVSLNLEQGYYTNTFYVNKDSDFSRVELLRAVQLNEFGLSQQGVNFNPKTGTYNVSQGVLNPTVSSVGDWWKFSYTIWSSGEGTSVFDYEATNFPSKIGDVFKLSGVQIEPGFKSTSTIITSGSTVTRGTDIIPTKNVSFNTGDDVNSGSIYIEFDAGEYYGLFIKGLGVGLSGISKVLFVFDSNNKKLYANGSLVDSQTGTYNWENLNTLDINGNYSGKKLINIICYNRPLTEDESINLTT